ncbi:MAG TPA: PH domain-containing protein [Pseudolysinimonas sp.]|nr:PH domain-containing protein [Pseudolysinimonas sp.]
MTDPRAAAPEFVVARLRRHGRALVWPVVGLLVIVGGVGFSSGLLRQEWLFAVVCGVASVLVVAVFVVPVLRWSASHTTVTSRRVIVREGLLVRTRHELLHSRRADVSVRVSGLQHLFRTGDVELRTESTTLVLHDLSSPHLVQEALHDLAEQSPIPPALWLREGAESDEYGERGGGGPTFR